MKKCLECKVSVHEDDLGSNGLVCKFCEEAATRHFLKSAQRFEAAQQAAPTTFEYTTTEGRTQRTRSGKWLMELD